MGLIFRGYLLERIGEMEANGKQGKWKISYCLLGVNKAVARSLYIFCNSAAGSNRYIEKFYVQRLFTYNPLGLIKIIIIKHYAFSGHYLLNTKCYFHINSK